MLHTWKTLFDFTLNEQRPLYKQLAEKIKGEIIRLNLPPGTPLPGSRVLSQKFNITRHTVINAYNLLADEGCINLEPKKGAFVASGMIVSPAYNVPEETRFSFNRFSPSWQPPEWPPADMPLSFDDGYPDLHYASYNRVLKNYKRIIEENLRAKKSWCSPEGRQQLRHELQTMLTQSRGLPVNTGSLGLIQGAQMPYFIIASLLLKRDEYMLVEDPGNACAWNAFRMAGAKLIPVKVDGEGISPDAVEEICLRKKKVKAVYVTPQCQYPTTVVLSPERRRQLLEMAEKYDFTIIEHDRGREFWFEGEPVLPLAAAGLEGRVIYMDSLSRTLTPLSNLSVIAGPPPFIHALRSGRSSLQGDGNINMEQTLALAVKEGFVSRQLKELQLHCNSKRKEMRRYIDRYLHGLVRFKQPAGGLAYWLEPDKPVNMPELISRLRKQGVYVIPPRSYSFHAEPLNGLRLGYASLRLPDIEKGIQLIGRALRPEIVKVLIIIFQVGLDAFFL